MATTDLGKNIHNAFSVVFNTYKSIEKLMLACQSDEVKQNYYLPTEKFLRYSSDQYWEGWVYWSFILLYQRNADGKCPENGWIDAPVYAVEINVDAETCEEPKIYVGKFEYKDICSWTPGCSPANHYIFYDAIESFFDKSYMMMREIMDCYQLRADVNAHDYFAIDNVGDLLALVDDAKVKVLKGKV